jgi:hypothetical protein
VPAFADGTVLCGQCDGSPRSFSRVSRPEPLLFLPGGSSVVLSRLSGLHSDVTVTVTSNRYFAMLENSLWPKLDNLFLTLLLAIRITLDSTS